MINLYCIRPKGFNIGNDVIYIAVRHFLRESIKRSLNIISIPATGKYESQKKAGITSQTVYEINHFGHALIIGGGNLYENGELEINPIALKALEKPMMVFSVSRGRIYNQSLELVDRTDVMTDDKIKILNQKAVVSMSRDIATKKYLDSLGCTNNLMGGCPTLFIDEIPQHQVPLVDHEKTDALISIRTPTLMSIPVSYQYDLRYRIDEMIHDLQDAGYKSIKILCHDHRDIPFAASFRDIPYLYTEDIFTYLTYLRNTRLNVTFRLHSFLPCMALDIPSIKISYDERALSLLESVGLSDWNINMLKCDMNVEFRNRLNNINELNLLKSDLRKQLWPDLREQMMGQCSKFASLITEKI